MPSGMFMQMRQNARKFSDAIRLVAVVAHVVHPIWTGASLIVPIWFSLISGRNDATSFARAAIPATTGAVIHWPPK